VSVESLRSFSTRVSGSHSIWSQDVHVSAGLPVPVTAAVIRASSLVAVLPSRSTGWSWKSCWAAVVEKPPQTPALLWNASVLPGPGVTGPHTSAVLRSVTFPFDARPPAIRTLLPKSTELRLVIA